MVGAMDPYWGSLHSHMVLSHGTGHGIAGEGLGAAVQQR